MKAPYLRRATVLRRFSRLTQWRWCRQFVYGGIPFLSVKEEASVREDLIAGLSATSNMNVNVDEHFLQVSGGWSCLDFECFLLLLYIFGCLTWTYLGCAFLPLKVRVLAWEGNWCQIRENDTFKGVLPLLPRPNREYTSGVFCELDAKFSHVRMGKVNWVVCGGCWPLYNISFRATFPGHRLTVLKSLESSPSPRAAAHLCVGVCGRVRVYVTQWPAHGSCSCSCKCIIMVCGLPRSAFCSHFSDFWWPPRPAVRPCVSDCLWP